MPDLFGNPFQPGDRVAFLPRGEKGTLLFPDYGWWRVQMDDHTMVWALETWFGRVPSRDEELHARAMQAAFVRE